MPFQLHRRATERGFGLLETLVALAILASVGGLLFVWMNQTLETAARLRRSDDEARLVLNAHALLATVNPLRLPEGEREVAGVRIRWQATPVQPVVSGRSFVDGQAGDWQIGLFKLAVDAEDRRANSRVRFEAVQVGLMPRQNSTAASLRDAR